MLRLRALSLIVLSLAPLRALAWGRDGHQIVALVAAAKVHNATATAIHQLLGNQTLADVAPEPDALRAKEKQNPTLHPRTELWHFIDIPLDEASYVPDRDCPKIANNEVDRNCVIAAIDHFQQVLANKHASPTDRKRALTFLVHFVGDIHQPLHTTSRFAQAHGKGPSDHGANGVTAILPVTHDSQPLHTVWDDVLIAEENEKLQGNHTPPEYVRHLLTDVLPTLPAAALAETSAVAWANSAHQLAINDAYKYPGTDHEKAPLDGAYLTKNEKVADEQLTLAGVHLAHLLDAALKP